MSSRRSAVSVASACVAALAWACFAGAGDADAYSRGLAWTRGCGWCALLALCAALCATPFGKLLRAFGMGPFTDLPAWRRALGIAAAGCALLHGASAFIWVSGTRERLWSEPQLRAGCAALLILTLLLATSFRPIVRNWKELHRLAYIAAAFAFVHVVLGPFAALRVVFALAAFTFTFGLLRWLRPM